MTQILDKQTAAPSSEEEMGQFLREIRSFPRLTEAQERQLARRCAAGDEEAIRQMVSTNLRLVVSVAREYAGRGVPMLDLIQEGSIGLLTAARKFDHTLDFRFSTYATKWIRQGISRYLAAQAGLIRVPEYTGDQIRRIQHAAAALRQETGMEPTPGEIAQKLAIAPEKVTELLKLWPEICSLDTPVGSGEDGTLVAMIEDAKAPQPQEELVRKELEDTMEALLSTLDPRHRRILELHFGMADGVCHSLEEIGKRMDISKERVRQIERSAMEKLHKQGALVGLEDFLNE